MNRLPFRFLTLLLCATLLLGLPFSAYATSSLDDTQEDTAQSIQNNPDLTDAEKAKWKAFACEVTGRSLEPDEED